MDKFEVVKLDARKLDSSSSSALRDAVTSAWRNASVIVLDLSNVIYIDSLGISALISEQRRRPNGGKIVLCSLTDYVQDVLEVTQLIRVFDIYADVEAARKALG
jgi:anti-sigma B factor antagonist